MCCKAKAKPSICAVWRLNQRLRQTSQGRANWQPTLNLAKAPSLLLNFPAVLTLSQPHIPCSAQDMRKGDCNRGLGQSAT